MRTDRHTGVIAMLRMLQGVHAVLPRGEGFFLDIVDIVIANDRIRAIGKDLDPATFGVEEVYPCNNKLVIPGLVNGHLHSHDRFDKGRFDNLPLEIWMALYNPPYESRGWTPRQIYLRTILNGIELLRSGTTTVIDDVHHGLSLSRENVEHVCQAYQDLGLRAQVSAAYSDKPFYKGISFLEDLLPDELKKNPNANLSPSTDSVLDLWSEMAGTWKGRVQFVLSPSGPQRCTDDFLRRTWQLAEKHDVPVIIHVLETRVQAYTGYAFYGKSLIEHMEALRVLSPRAILIHAVWVNEKDIELIARSGASVIHCPVSNLKIGSGIAPVERIRKAGINVGLGTDNNNANDSANMFETMKLAALIHKVKSPYFKDWLGAKDAFQMATGGGSRAGHLQNIIGSIEVGKKADLVLLDLNSLPLFPANNLLNQLVFAEHGESISQVIVDGKVVLDKGTITQLDEQAIMDEIREEAKTIQHNIERTVAAGKRLEPYLEAAYLKCIEQSASIIGSEPK
jgi:5-methylthioadenosine/S-adenosylhomocysteine deaminase